MNALYKNFRFLFKTDESNDSKMVILIVNNEEVGFIEIQEFWNDKDYYFDFLSDKEYEKYLTSDSSYIAISKLKVYEKYQNLGYAKILLDYAIKQFIPKYFDTYYKYLVLNASPERNTIPFLKLIKFYSKFGFKIIHKEVNNAIMIKKLK